MEETERFDDCVGIRESVKAVLVFIEDLDESWWIPKSVIDDDSEVYKKGTSGTLVIQKWFATRYINV